MSGNEPIIAVAPMMEHTDRHFRYFMRLLSRRVRLYTEMVTTGAIIHGDTRRLLEYDPIEHPVALQIGGADAGDLARCAGIATAFGYDEVNLNVGCPSDRVQAGRFGACLLAEPETVAAGVAAMRSTSGVPVTVKTRIGVDDRDRYEHLAEFVGRVAAAGCDTFFIHARKAWLKGLSPKDNRTVPSLRHDVVFRLKRDFPQLTIVLNGGVRTLDRAEDLLRPRDAVRVDGVMIGRAAYENPYELAAVDQRFFGAPASVASRHEIVERLIPYVERERERGTYLSHITRHIINLFHASPGARSWRRHLTVESVKPGAGSDVIRQAAAMVGERLVV